MGDELETIHSDYKQIVIEKYRCLRNKDKILFVGNRSDVLEILHSCDVSFITSKHEGFPNAVIEAMAVGVPVVSSDYSDIKDILPKPWQVVELRDANSFAETIQRVSQERSVISAGQLMVINEKFEMSVSANSMLNAYAEIIGRC